MLIQLRSFLSAMIFLALATASQADQTAQVSTGPLDGGGVLDGSLSTGGPIVTLPGLPSLPGVDLSVDPDDTGASDEKAKDLDLIPGTIPKIDVLPIFSVSAEMPKVPDTLMSLKVIPHDPMKGSSVQTELANHLAFEARTMGVDEDQAGTSAVMYTDAEGRSMEIFRSGALFYMEEELFSEKANDLLASLRLDRDSAKKHFTAKAEDFLGKVGAAQGGHFLKDVSFAEVKTMRRDSQSDEEVKVVAAAVQYGLEIGGVPAWGPGAKTTVYFDAEGITGFYDATRKFEAAEEVKLVSPAEAVSSYIKGDVPRSILRQHTGVVDNAVIEDVSLVYYMDAGNRDQEIIDPYYLIQGTMYGWNPGPDSADPRRDSKNAEPAPFMWLERAVVPAPEPGSALQLAAGLFALIGLSRARGSRTR